MQTFSFRFNKIGVIAVMFALAMLAATPATAGDVTFAQVSQTTDANQWTISTTGTTTTITASGDVYFSYLVGVPGLSGPQEAAFTFTATSSSFGSCATNCGNDDGFTQGGYSGTFTYTDLANGQNLLSGTFTVVASGGTFGSNVGGSGGSFNVTTAGGNNQLMLTSAYLGFSGMSDEDASWSLSSLIPVFAINQTTATGGYVADGTFTMAGTATFSSDQTPAVMPEPGTFAMIGGGLIGLGLLRRKKSPRKLAGDSTQAIA